MRSFRVRGQKGYTLMELLVVMVIVGIMAFVAVPYLLSYIPSATANYAAREVQGALNRAKLQAVASRQAICVQIVSGGYQYVVGGCGGAVWTGPGTDASGIFRIANNMTLTQNAGLSPIFNQFGVATQTGSFRITGATGVSQTISVAASGRVTIP